MIKQLILLFILMITMPRAFSESSGQLKQIKDTSYHSNSDTNLDLYYRPSSSKRPIVVFVHGGSWIKGDKGHISRNPQFASFFIERGFQLASINFRKAVPNSKSNSYKEQLSDIAKSLAWITKNGEQYSIDSQHIILFGFSSGAHLVAMLNTDHRYLQAENLSPKQLKATISMDVHAYDVPLAINIMRSSVIAHRIPFLKSILGFSNAEQLAASPASYLSNKDISPMLIISGSNTPQHTFEISEKTSAHFQKKLLQHGHSAEHFHFPKRHIHLMTQFAQEGDQVAKTVEKFLRKYTQH